MLRLSLLLSPLLFAPVADKAMRPAEGGSIIEQRATSTPSCALVLYDRRGQFAFTWGRGNGPVRVIVSHQGWMFASDEITPVSLRIGDVWLDDGNGIPNIPALGRSDSLMLVVNQPIERLLSAADGITLQSPDLSFSLFVGHARMRRLLATLRRCGAAIRR